MTVRTTPSDAWCPTVSRMRHKRGTMFVGQAADTPALAGGNSAEWCATELRERYPDATHVMIAADRGGHNSARLWVWQEGLQAQVADRLGLNVTICDYPTGASQR